MKKQTLKLISIIALTLIPFLISANMVLAISNPDNIAFGSGTTPLYKVFENVAETGDMLFVAEGLIEYTVTPTDYTASEAFLFEVLNTAGNVTLLSRPIEQWGNRPISIYQTAAQKTALGLSSGTAYVLRLAGNPLIFPSLTGNSITVTLNAGDYIDQSIGATSETPTDNNLRNFLIQMAENIEDFDTPVSAYLTTVQGYRYLTNAGGSIFSEGIPNLSTLCPIVFQYGASQMSSDAPESTGSYALTLTPLNKWGQLTADGLTNLGVFLGVNQALAGSVVLFILVIALAVYVYQKTQSGVTVMLMVAAAPIIGGYLGLMPMALVFVFVIIIIALMGFYFFSRSTL